MGITERLLVDDGEAAYPIYVCESFELLAKAFYESKLTGRSLCLVMDMNSEKLFGPEVEAICGEFSKKIVTYTIDSEDSGFDAVEKIYTCLAENDMCQKSVVVGVGSRRALSIAGFAAATYMGGISFAEIPTTLRSQVDAVNGGRLLISFKGRKALIGTKICPVFIYVNIIGLTTLSEINFQDGIAEAVKNSIIWGQGYLAFLTQNKEAIKSLEAKALAGVILGSCRVKAGTLLREGKERCGEGVLEFGKAIGGAILRESKHTLAYGAALSIGCMATVKICAERDCISQEDYAIIYGLFKFFDLCRPVSGISPHGVFETLMAEAAVRSCEPSIVMLNPLGYAYFDTSFSRDEIVSALSEFLM